MMDFRRFSSLLVIFVLLGSSVFPEANAQYGNEWINFGQPYYRIPVGRDGLYRITHSDLQQAGFPVASADPRRFQLFHRGAEIAIHVEGESDAQFNTTDYIEFYGMKNDGTQDVELYQPLSAQPHKYLNLFSDTAVYFLTVNPAAIPGKRMARTWEVNVGGLPPAPAHHDEKLMVLMDEHSNGTAYSTFVRNTFFDVGEAWTGRQVLQNNVIDYTLESIVQGVQTSGVPQLQVLVTGRSDVDAPHRAEIYVGPTTGSLRLLTTQDILKFNFVLIEQPLAWSDIGADGKMIVRLRVLATGASARASVSYIRLRYPQNFNASSQTEKYFLLNPNAGGKSFIDIQNPPAGGRLYDITDPVNTIWYVPPGAAFNPVISNTQVVRRLLLTSTILQVGKISRVNFRSISPAQPAYIIISHSQLMVPAGGYANPVKAFAGYRASVAGGGYDTLVVDVNQLYNQFTYGEISPLAIHRFMKFMVDGGSPRYLFLIGKGLDWFLNYHRRPSSPEFAIYKDLVPTAGWPASDLAFTTGLGSTTYEPAVPTGRISATNAGQVAAYLNKVIEMEALPFDALWRKRVVHLSGGLNDAEATNFRFYLEGYESIAEGPYLGGEVKAQAKNTTNVGELVNISTTVNEGVNLITFFGHSSATTSDFEVGFVTNPSLGYNNPGKYPMFLVNGCNAGDFFARDTRYGEDWILAANKGATAFIAHSSFGFTQTLRFYSHLFYQLAFADTVLMRQGVGDIQKEVARQYMTFMEPTANNLTQISQMFLLGDPALRVFGARQPDYELNTPSVRHVSLDGEPVTAFSEAFALQLHVMNFGRVHTDSLRIRITRIFNDASSESYDSLFAPVLNQDTLTFIIRQERNKGFGNNTFIIELDPENDVLELNEENNRATYDLFVPLNLTRNLFPVNFGIIGQSSVNFLFSSTDILGEARDFELEIDTAYTFNSAFKKSFVVNGKIASQQVDLLTQDSLVYYWRTRFKDPLPGEVAEWVVSSFTIISNTSGWGQLQFPQYLTNSTEGLVADPGMRVHSYKETVLAFDIFTLGSNHTLPSTNVSVKINNEEYNPVEVAQQCRNNTINLIAFDKRSTIPYTAVQFNPFDGRACGRRPQVINSYEANQLLTGGGNDIAQYMLNVPEGDSVILFTIGDPGVALWSAAIKQQFEALGISAAQLNSVLAGEPIVIYAKKGTAPGSALVFRPAGTPANEQELLVNGTITGRFDSGLMKSPLIGPATAWSTLITQAVLSEVPKTDNFTFDVYGVQLDETETLLQQGIIGTMDLSGIPAGQYPYLRLTYNTSDEINLTPPQLKKWMVLFAPAPEGVLSFTKPETDPQIQEGENWTGSFGFTNISSVAFTDSLTVQYKTINLNTGTTDLRTNRINAPSQGQTTPFDITLSTLDKAGKNDVEVYVNPRLVPEVYYDNNIMRAYDFLTVIPDSFNPVLDVLVDGRNLQNGDFISPNPLIEISVWDENPFIPLTDTTSVSIRLTFPADAFATPIYFSRSDVTWFAQTFSDPYRVQFSPVNLPDGEYVLEVDARDKRGNPSGSDPYQITFLVSREAKVLLAAPYPNPSSSGFTFEFVIAGEQAPDRLVVEIVSPSGLKIRELEATGFIIGTNQLYWAGDDSAGNSLPGGLYIYHIKLFKDGQPVSVMNPEGERHLKNGYGKIIIR